MRSIGSRVAQTLQGLAQWERGWISEYGSNSGVTIGAPLKFQYESPASGGMAYYGWSTKFHHTPAVEDQEFLSEPSEWLDNRVGKKCLKSPNLRDKCRREVLCMEGWSNRPWMIAELAPMAQSGDGSVVDVRHGGPGQEYNRMARLDQAQLFVEHEIGGFAWSVTTAFQRPREGVNKRFSGIAGYVKELCKAGRLKEAVHIVNRGGFQADSSTYICLLQECMNMNDLAEGKQVHNHIIQSGFKPDIFVRNTLTNMYAKCGSMIDARQVFDTMPDRDMFTWSIMIAGYAKHACGREALKIYKQMEGEGVIPNRVTFICVLNACASLGALERGKEVHADIIKSGIASYINLENALVVMYTKCGSIWDAQQVFDSMAHRDVVSWTAMITAYAQHACGREALKTYEQMQDEGVVPNRVTFISVLNACASLGALEKGKEVHADITKAGIASCVKLENTLIDMYAKCGSMKYAHQVFSGMAKQNVVSWNAMIAGYTQSGCGREAFEIYEQMQRKGVAPDTVTFTCVLNACTSLGALGKIKEVHVEIMKSGSAADVILETALVVVYAKCGSMNDAHEAFDNMATRDVISWNAMITGYAQHGCCKEALQLFEQMVQKDVKPDCITFISLLSACSHMGLVDEGLHYFDSMGIDHGLTATVEHYGCAVDLLGRAGRLVEAENLINKMPIEPGVRVWGSLLGACRIHSNVEVAERAAKSFIKCPQQAAPYVLLSNNLHSG